MAASALRPPAAAQRRHPAPRTLDITMAAGRGRIPAAPSEQRTVTAGPGTGRPRAERAGREPAAEATVWSGTDPPPSEIDPNIQTST